MAFLNKLRVNGTDYDIKSSITYTDETVSSWAAVASNESDKKGCQSEIVSSAIIVPIIASSLLAVLLILRKKGAHYEK